MIYFNVVRLALIFWSMLMISSVEFVGIRTEGQVEIDSSSRDAYSKVLILCVGSFLGDLAYRARKK